MLWFLSLIRPDESKCGFGWDTVTLEHIVDNMSVTGKLAKGLHDIYPGLVSMPLEAKLILAEVILKNMQGKCDHAHCPCCSIKPPENFKPRSSHPHLSFYNFTLEQFYVMANSSIEVRRNCWWRLLASLFPLCRTDRVKFHEFMVVVKSMPPVHYRESLFYGSTLLHAFATSRLPSCVREVINLHPQAASTRDCLGRTPLHVAASLNRNVTVIKLLLESNPSASLVRDNCGMLPVHHAAGGNTVASVEFLIQSSGGVESLWEADFNGMLPIHHAAKSNRLDVVRLLLHRAPLSARHATTQSTLPPQNFTLVTDDSFDRLPLHYAAEYNPSPQVLVELYLAYRDGVGTPDSKNEHPLHKAMKSVFYRDATIHLQLRDGVGELSSSVDLHTRPSQHEHIALLLAWNVDSVFEVSDSGFSVLHWACSKWLDIEIVRDILWECSADPDFILEQLLDPLIIYGDNWLAHHSNVIEMSRPIHIAAAQGRMDIVQEFMKWMNNVAERFNATFAHNQQIDATALVVEDGNGRSVVTYCGLSGKDNVLEWGQRMDPVGCERPDSAGRLTLHDICLRCNSGSPLTMISKTLKLFPDAVKQQDIFGACPFIDCLRVCNIEAAWELFQSYPLSINYIDKGGMDGSSLMLLIRAVRDINPSSADLVKCDAMFAAVIAHNPLSVDISDRAGDLPLHLAMHKPGRVHYVKSLIRLSPLSSGVKNEKGKTPYDVFNDWTCPSRSLSSVDAEILRCMLEHHPTLDPSRLRLLRWNARRMALLVAIAPMREGNLAGLNILSRLEHRSFDTFKHAVLYL